LVDVRSLSSCNHACGGGGYDIEHSYGFAGHDSGSDLSTFRLDYHSPDGSIRSSNLKLYVSNVLVTSVG